MAQEPELDLAGTSLERSLVSWGRITGSVLGFVVVTLLGLLAVDQLVYQPRVDRLIDGTGAVREAHGAMLDQQVGLRGFLLSGDPRFLEAYEDGAAELPALTTEATRVLGGDEELGEPLVSMLVAQRAWLDQWATEALEAGRDPASVSGAFVRRDKELFDRYRAEVDVLIDRLVERRDATVEDHRRALVVAIGLALAATVGGGLLARQRSRELQASVSEPLTGLLERLTDIRRGDFEPRALPGGPAEFRILGAGLEGTARALAGARRTADEQTVTLEARNRRQEAVLKFAREVSGNLSLRYVLRGVCTHAADVSDGARVLVWLTDPERRELEAVADSDGPELHPIGLAPRAMDDDIVGRAGQFGRVFGGERDHDRGHLAVPMVVGAQVIGVLELIGAGDESLAPDVVRVLETMAVHAATSIEAARLHSRTSDHALTDVLTGLPNRRNLDEDLQTECAAAARYDRPFALLMIDVDHFKSYNDTFGHQAGDVALQEIARALAENLRATDRAYRFGGEEFIVLLRETPIDAAGAFAERLRRSVEHRFAGPERLRPITISVGVAATPEQPAVPGALVAAADAALYDAKRNGRNQWMQAPDLAAEAPASAEPPVR